MNNEIQLGNKHFKIIVARPEPTLPFNTEQWHLVLQGDYSQMRAKLEQFDFTGEAVRRMETALDWLDAGTAKHVQGMLDEPYDRTKPGMLRSRFNRFYLVQENRSRLRRGNHSIDPYQTVTK